jgi:hypothetical protein
MLRERPQGAMVPLSADQVPRLFEKGYAELVFWRKNKGLSPEEVAKVAVSLKRNPIRKTTTSGQ